jgi:hypothetical protein
VPDDLGNTFVVTQMNNVIKLGTSGDSLASFSALQYGQVFSLDATNPLRIMAFYRQFAVVVMLDRFLTTKEVIYLRDWGIAVPLLACVARSGNIWVYDGNDARLKLIGQDGKTIVQSLDLRKETGAALLPIYLKEQGNSVYLYDSTQGLLVFDRYANLLNKLELPKKKSLGIDDRVVSWLDSGKLYHYDLQSFATTITTFPLSSTEVMGASSLNKRWYLRYADSVVVRQP